MLKNKKILLIILICLIVVIAILIGAIVVVNNMDSQEEMPQEEEQLSEEVLANSFRNRFLNIEYTEDETNIVSKGYFYEEEKESQYSIKLNVPKINLETETVAKINKDILNTYGNKLLDIMKNNKEYTIYNVDFITHINENIVSLVIKTVLKEGNNPQRVAMQTYNYNVEADKIVTLDEILTENNIEKSAVQTKILNTVREKNVNTQVLAEQGYNIYVRDIRSDEYLIENIENFFIGEEGHIYILFPYGNKNFTETMDVVIL